MEIRKAKHSLLNAPVVQHSLEFDAAKLSVEILAPLGVVLPPTLERAVARRQIEWILSRHCVRLACHELGVYPLPTLLSRADRSPIWPSGVVGSLTHTEGFVSAAVARESEVRGLGIDSECIMSEAVAEQVRAEICVPAETLAMGRMDAASALRYLTLVFSAKESLYKCLYPSVGKFFSYHDAVVKHVDRDKGKYEGVLAAELSSEFRIGTRFQGIFHEEDRLVHTAMVLPQF
jgi:enterobactin synthetase component D